MFRDWCPCDDVVDTGSQFTQPKFLLPSGKVSLPPVFVLGVRVGLHQRPQLLALFVLGLPGRFQVVSVG